MSLSAVKFGTFLGMLVMWDRLKDIRCAWIVYAPVLTRRYIACVADFLVSAQGTTSVDITEIKRIVQQSFPRCFFPCFVC
jgi:hypothetical protein